MPRRSEAEARTDRVQALLAEAPGLERASHVAPTCLPVTPAFEGILPFGGLRPGSTLSVTGVGATSLALALVARASRESWTAAVGVPTLGLPAAADFGVELDHLVVVPDPASQWTPVLAAVVDAFDLVVARPMRISEPKRLSGRVRERDAVLVVVGSWQESDLTLHAAGATWHGMGRGYGHLRTRTIDVTVSGRGAASRPRHATLWLPDLDGQVSPAATVSPIRKKTG